MDIDKDTFRIRLSELRQASAALKGSWMEHRTVRRTAVLETALSVMFIATSFFSSPVLLVFGVVWLALAFCTWRDAITSRDRFLFDQDKAHLPYMRASALDEYCEMEEDDRMRLRWALEDMRALLAPSSDGKHLRLSARWERPTRHPYGPPQPGERGWDPSEHNANDHQEN